MDSDPIEGGYTVVSEEVVGVTPPPPIDFTVKFDIYGKPLPFKEMRIPETELAKQYDLHGVNYFVEMKMKMGGFIYVDHGSHLHFCGRVVHYQCEMTRHLIVQQFIDEDDARKIPLSAKQLGTLGSRSLMQIRHIKSDY